VSTKGKIRAEIAQMVLDEIKAGTLEALIARAADFYGPGIKNSILNEVVFNNLKVGKKANWFCSVNYLHNFTFTPDAAKATALLGNSGSAYGQVWHLPTAAPITGKQWIEKIANELGVKPKTQVASKFITLVMGLFNPIMKEFVEMLYQYDRDYNFDSSKFENTFKMKPTSVDDGIKQVINSV
jgi:nucleoside-diphosphate-sugar epimerase